MTITLEQLTPLVDAQFKVETAELSAHNANIGAITMTPSNVWSENLNEWRDSQTAPAKAALAQAIAERDRAVQELGLDLERWLKVWAGVKKELIAQKQAAQATPAQV